MRLTKWVLPNRLALGAGCTMWGKCPFCKPGYTKSFQAQKKTSFICIHTFEAQVSARDSCKRALVRLTKWVLPSRLALGAGFAMWGWHCRDNSSFGKHQVEQKHFSSPSFLMQTHKPKSPHTPLRILTKKSRAPGSGRAGLEKVPMIPL